MTLATRFDKKNTTFIDLFTCSMNDICVDDKVAACRINLFFKALCGITV